MRQLKVRNNGIKIADRFDEGADQWLKALESHLIGNKKSFCLRIKKSSQLQAWIDEKGLTVEEFVTQLANKSENNFMYLKYVLPDIKNGKYKDLSIESLPQDSHKNAIAPTTRENAIASSHLPNDKIFTKSTNHNHDTHKHRV